jgi:hypothetical protein
MTQPESQSVHDNEDAILVVEPVHDFYLHVLLKILELDENNSIGMSFNVGGGMVYGQMISHAVWEKLWIEQVDAASGFAGDVLKEVARLRSEEAANEEPTSRFVHLKNATFLSGNTRQRLGLWRGPLAQISGWTNSTPAD